MNLHQNQNLFKEIIEAVSQNLGVREVFIEKDYWVTIMLKNLSCSKYFDSVVFKGGTSLSKAYRLIERFSEDVDLALITTPDISGNQIKKKIKEISQSITHGFTEIYDPEITSKGSKIRKTLHAYEKIIDSDNFGQASDKVLLEINSFTSPHPYSPQEISSFIKDFLMEKAPELVQEFDLNPFKVNVLSLERTYVEKILAIVRASYSKDPIGSLGRVIRHIYDLHILTNQPVFRNFLSTPEFFDLIKLVKADDYENSEFRGDWLNKPLSESIVFKDTDDTWNKLSGVYQKEFSSLLFGSLPPESEVKQTLLSIFEGLVKFDIHPGH